MNPLYPEVIRNEEPLVSPKLLIIIDAAKANATDLLDRPDAQPVLFKARMPSNRVNVHTVVNIEKAKSGCCVIM